MNERERLTEHFGDGVRYGNGEYTITCYPKNKNLNPVDKLAVKLCELEDKIENGTLIELPCKVGDTVYRIVELLNGEIFLIEGEVAEISLIHGHPEGGCFYFRAKGNEITSRGYSLLYYLTDFNKTVFPTKEEAEKALAEREQK